MTRLGIGILAAAFLVSLMPAPTAQAVGLANRRAARHAQTMSWHGAYYNTQYGVPLALVVPPTVDMQTHWGWGVSQSSMTPIYHQFRRPYPGAMQGGGTALMPTPNWPSHTTQFGVNYIRGPW